MTLIGFTGHARSGKDTAAALLVERYGFRRFAFADIMKEFALALDPLIRIEYLDTLVTDGTDLWGLPTVRLAELVDVVGWDEAKKIRDVRRTLQRLGTEAGRGVFGEDFWVDRTFAKIVDYCGLFPDEAPLAPVTITDVRFPNENQAIQDDGGIVIRLVRPGAAQATSHPSEDLVDSLDVDYEIVNDGSVADLHRRVAEIVASDEYVHVI